MLSEICHLQNSFIHLVWSSAFKTMAIKPIRNQKNKNPPFLSHEFVIQNHADIISCVAMVFVVGLMLQVSQDLLKYEFLGKGRSKWGRRGVLMLVFLGNYWEDFNILKWFASGTGRQLRFYSQNPFKSCNYMMPTWLHHATYPFICVNFSFTYSRVHRVWDICWHVRGEEIRVAM